MAQFSDPFDTLANLQQALDTFRASRWLAAGPSGGGSYPPMNVFRKGDDLTIRLAGTKSVDYPDKAGLHRRERLAGRFDRVVTLPVEIDQDGVKAECRDGILALFLPRAERDKPKSIQVA
jgi:HSP20 family protein